MLQLTKRLPLAPIQLSALLVGIYFLVYRFSFLTFGLMVLGLFFLFLNQGKRIFCRVLPILACFFLLFAFQRFQLIRGQQEVPLAVGQLQLRPDTIQVNGDRLSFRASAKGKLYSVFYQLQNQEEKEYFQQLASLVTLEVEASLSEPEGQRNFNGFDYKDYLSSQGIYHTLKIHQVTKIQKRVSYHPMEILSLLRRKALVFIQNHFPSPMKHYMTGLLFGYLDKEFDQMGDVYSSLGIIHLFALSGMQVGFFISFFQFICLRLGMTKETVNYLQLPFSFIYAGLTGFSISVNRSLLQKIMANYGISKLDNLAYTILISFFVMPHFLLSVGGVLSFAYAFLLTVFDFEKMSRYKRILVESLAISFGILPLLLFYFYRFQPLSILLTFLFSFLFDSILLPGLAIIFLLSPVVVISQVNVVFIWMEMAIRWLADSGLKPLVLGKPSPLLLLLFFLLLFWMYDRYQLRKKIGLLSSLLILLLFMVKHPLENEVTIIDVGQGDSIFLRDMRGRTVLIDVGGRLDFLSKEEWQKAQTTSNAERTVIPYLYSRGVSKIDTLVLTHTDTDHVGDLEEVANAFEIGSIYVTEGSLEVPNFVKRLAELQIPIHRVKQGDKIPIFDRFLEVLSPYEKGDGGNDDSIVLYGNILQTRFLFTGDLEEGEDRLRTYYPQLAVDVLKAGHHGSKGSSHPAFLDHISPRIALISAGKNNRYQHPHQETLERFEERNITVFRTDEQGAIRFRGFRTWTIETVQ